MNPVGRSERGCRGAASRRSSNGRSYALTAASNAANPSARTRSLPGAAALGVIGEQGLLAASCTRLSSPNAPRARQAAARASRVAPSRHLCTRLFRRSRLSRARARRPGPRSRAKSDGRASSPSPPILAMEARTPTSSRVQGPVLPERRRSRWTRGSGLGREHGQDCEHVQVSRSATLPQPTHGRASMMPMMPAASATVFQVPTGVWERGTAMARSNVTPSATAGHRHD